MTAKGSYHLGGCRSVIYAVCCKNMASPLYPCPAALCDLRLTMTALAPPMLLAVFRRWCLVLAHALGRKTLIGSHWLRCGDTVAHIQYRDIQVIRRAYLVASD